MKSNMKFIISTLVFLLATTILVLIMVFGFDMKIFKVCSIKELTGEHNLVANSQSNLQTGQDTYKSKLSTLKSTQDTYSVEKAKYDTISDETINIIKDATTKENYNIEYMWIKLGNYAKTNNLSIIVVEPGGSTSAATPTTATGTTTSPTTTGTTGTSTQSKDSSTTTPNPTATKTSTNTTGTGAAGTSTNSQTTSNDLRVQISGSYINISDFIFEVENDTELRFKLDNISMDYVSGTSIKASFNVKNMVINK